MNVFQSVMILRAMNRKAAAVVAGAALSLLGFAASAQSALLLTVDVSNPNAVTFTASDKASQVDDSSANVQYGVVLLSFFETDIGNTWGTMSGNLTPPSNRSQVYNYWMRDTEKGDIYGVNLQGFTGTYNGPELDIQNFSTLSPAFTGTGTIDLSIFSASLPSAGATGNIWAGYSGLGSHAVIGQWVAVPEPMTMSLLALGGLAMIRRRSH